ncbi:hypothetical protein C8R45DRAFT_1165255 [Mycena sanguinolenta]|nr:hypothetical protein C8R45DRAFT_1165255 [Mycena sanguinolenta]
MRIPLSSLRSRASLHAVNSRSNHWKSRPSARPGLCRWTRSLPFCGICRPSHPCIGSPNGQICRAWWKLLHILRTTTQYSPISSIFPWHSRVTTGFFQRSLTWLRRAERRSLHRSLSLLCGGSISKRPTHMSRISNRTPRRSLHPSVAPAKRPTRMLFPASMNYSKPTPFCQCADPCSSGISARSLPWPSATPLSAPQFFRCRGWMATIFCTVMTIWCGIGWTGRRCTTGKGSSISSPRDVDSIWTEFVARSAIGDEIHRPSTRHSRSYLHMARKPIFDECARASSNK